MLDLFNYLASAPKELGIVEFGIFGSVARRPIGESPMAYQLRDLGHSHLMAMPF